MGRMTSNAKGRMLSEPYAVEILPGVKIAPASPIDYVARADKAADAAKRDGYAMRPEDVEKLAKILGNKRGAYPFSDELTYRLISIANKAGYTVTPEDAYRISEKAGIPAVACTDLDKREISIDTGVLKNEAEARAILYHEVIGHALPRNADEKKAQALAAMTAEEMGDVLALHYVNMHSENLGYPELVKEWRN